MARLTEAERIDRELQQVIRYVVTFKPPGGIRELVGPIQGRNTYETPELAQAQLDAMIANNSPATLARHFPGELKVMPCPCWPVHFDPKGCYFND